MLNWNKTRTLFFDMGKEFLRNTLIGYSLAAVFIGGAILTKAELNFNQCVNTRLEKCELYLFGEVYFKGFSKK